MRIEDVGGTSRASASTTARPAPPPPPPANDPAVLVDRATPMGSTRPDVQKLAGLVGEVNAANPQSAAVTKSQFETYLTPVEYGQFLRAVKADEAGKDCVKDGWGQTAKDRHENVRDPLTRYDVNGDGFASPAEKAAVNKADIMKVLGFDVPIEHLHLRDADYEGIPQGQGYDSLRNQFLTTYYRKDGKDGTDVRLSIQDKYTGMETDYVKLKDENGKELSHGGGVSISGKWVLVSDGGNVYAYDRAKITAAGSGGEVKADNVTDTKVSSFMNVSPDGKYAYVGEFDKNLPGTNPFKWGSGEVAELYRYEIDQKTGALINQSGPQEIPDNAQGIAITNEGVIITTSYGKLAGINEVYFQEFSMDPSKGFGLEEKQRLGEIDNYGEGANIIGNTLYVTHESGAEEYDGKGGSQSIQKYDLDDFNW